MNIKAEWHTFKSKYIRRPFWDNWGWLGVSLGWLTVRLWWTGSGSVSFFVVSIFAPHLKHRHFEWGKYSLIDHLVSISTYPSQARDDYSHVLNVRLGRAEISFCLYKIAPSAARPDLWGTDAR